MAKREFGRPTRCALAHKGMELYPLHAMARDGELRRYVAASAPARHLLFVPFRFDNLCAQSLRALTSLYVKRRVGWIRLPALPKMVRLFGILLSAHGCVI